MTLQLTPYVEGGEIYHSRRNRVTGVLGIRGWPEPLSLELTGNPAPVLRGKRLLFGSSSEDEEAAGLRGKQGPGLDPRQFGALVAMTVFTRARKTGEFTESADSDGGGSPSGEWTRCLYLEWLGNSGRIVVALEDPEMYFVENRDGEEVHLLPEFPEEVVRGSGKEPFAVGQLGGIAAPAGFPAEGDSDEVDGVGNSRDPEKVSDVELTLKELDFLEERARRGEGVNLAALLGAMPDWKGLDEGRAEILLRELVGKLALYRVAYEVCEHCTAREAYRILVHKLAREAEVDPVLQDTSWVAHFDTSEHCQECIDESDMLFPDD